MTSYLVHLDAFHGPLDLLLHLVKRDEVDIFDIPIARLADQFLDHLRVVQHLDVELAGEFLVMAATLMEIKSRTLVPDDTPLDGDDEGRDERRFAGYRERYVGGGAYGVILDSDLLNDRNRVLNERGADVIRSRNGNLHLELARRGAVS